EQIVCTQEAKQCPDGSYVSRIGLKCEFAQCPGLKASIPQTNFDISTWKTYRNEKYGFEFKYPSTLEFIDKSTPYPHMEKYKRQLFEKGFSLQSTQGWQIIGMGPVELLASENWKEIARTKLSGAPLADGMMNGKEVLLANRTDTQENLQSFSKWVYLTDTLKKEIMEFSLDTNLAEKSYSEEVFNNLLSTFEFTQ
ncbi:MAG: hypothetical protein HY001_05355, partial [Candidatus Portnoybacteria bacterium]|nr:hypothetical protein [Candidatus Portnoybacteria bacterium]